MVDTLLVIIIFGGVTLSLGWLVNRSQWGIGTALVLSLWLILVLAVAMPFGWRAWVGDVMLAGIILGIGLWRYFRQAEPDNVLSGLDWALFGVVALIFVVPALVLPVPLDTDAQGFGYLALTAKLGGDLTTLAPLQPEIDYLYAPGFTVMVAYVSERLSTPLHSTQFAIGAVLSVMFVLVMYDFGMLLGGKPRAWAHVMAALIGTGLFTAYMDSHYTSLLGLTFGGAFLALVYQWVAIRAIHRVALTVGITSIFLAALALSHPDTTIIIALGFGAWLLLMPLANPRVSLRAWLIVSVVVSLIALVLVLPWLLSVIHLLGSEIASPFERYPDYWRVVLSVPPQMLYHGGAIVLVSLFGAVIGLRQRRHEALMAVGWLLLILDFSTFGILEHWLPVLVAPIVRYDYPFSLAWHGPIIPYVLLGGLALAWVWEKFGASRAMPLRRIAYVMLAFAAVAIITAGIFNRQILALSKERVTFFGAFASHADVEAMMWIQENTNPDALILNFPGPQEGDWVPVITERKTVYYRPQPFFQRGDDPLADTPEQVALRAFWEDPASPENGELLREAGINYVIVPQVVGNPQSFETHFRWRRPFTDLIEMESSVSDVPYLVLEFDVDGAEVYRVMPYNEFLQDAPNRIEALDGVLSLLYIFTILVSPFTPIFLFTLWMFRSCVFEGNLKTRAVYLLMWIAIALISYASAAVFSHHFSWREREELSGLYTGVMCVFANPLTLLIIFVGGLRVTSIRTHGISQLTRLYATAGLIIWTAIITLAMLGKNLISLAELVPSAVMMTLHSFITIPVVLSIRKMKPVYFIIFFCIATGAFWSIGKAVVLAVDAWNCSIC